MFTFPKLTKKELMKLLEDCEDTDVVIVRTKDGVGVPAIHAGHDSEYNQSGVERAIIITI